MTIEAKFTEDGAEVGSIVAVRLNPLNQPADDDVCVYAWTVLVGGVEKSSDTLGTVEHRHGDGPPTLIARIVDKAG